MKNIQIVLLLISAISITSFLVYNYEIKHSDVVIKNNVLTRPDLLKKFDEGFTEVCFRNIVEENKMDSPIVRSCLLDGTKWHIQKSTPFYIRMITDDFCAYRLDDTDKYYSGHKAYGQIYDGKNDPTRPCNIPFELNWERKNWHMEFTEYNDKPYILVTLFKEHRTL